MQCIEVTTGRSGDGYGLSHVPVGRNSSVMVYAHRVAFEKAWGITLKAGQVVRHTCDNPPCVNPLHLMLGTQGDNMRDMTGKGNHANAKKTHCPKGHEYEAGRRTHCRACRKQRHAEFVKNKEQG